MAAEQQLRSSASAALSTATVAVSSATAVAEDQQPLVQNRCAVVPAPGLAVYSTDAICGVPLSFLQLMQNMPVLHQAVVFLTMHQVGWHY